MSCKKPLILLLVLAAVVGTAVESRADISNAAVLFLRIAPGARAAGMGEAYVALADDATATHYNPAGLGSYPLADSWLDVQVPERFRPVKAIAALQREGGSDYQSYDIWALTPQGLVRYDHRRWYLAEVFGTKTDQTVQELVKSYYDVEDEQVLARMVHRVAEANSAWTKESLEAFRDQVLGAVPEDFEELEMLQQTLDSLVAGYDRCLINWDRVKDAYENYLDGFRDSTLTGDEAFKISVDLERARNRFIPEDLVIPYDVLFEEPPTVLAASLKELLVGTPNGLYAFNGRRWINLSGDEDLPSRNILSLQEAGGSIYVGTDKGLARFVGRSVAPIDSASQLPPGPVTAIGARGSSDVWAAINGDLYHWDGLNWSNTFDYTIAVDDSGERIAERFSIYGTPAAREAYLAKLNELNPDLPSGPISVAPVPATPEVEASVASPDSAGTTGSDTSDTQIAAPPVSTGGIEPGTVIKAPFLADLKGEITEIYVSYGEVWLGTDHGVMVFDYRRWRLPGYRDRVVAEGETIEELVPRSRGVTYVDHLRRIATICEINGLEYEQGRPLPVGQTIKVPRNPAAAPVQGISGDASTVFIATTEALLQYSEGKWSFVDQQGLDRANVVFVRSTSNGLWAATDDKIVVNANGRTQVALMYAKWLPELADDLYYAFASATASAGGWGTFGGNITFISYGTFTRTGQTGPEPIGTFESFDIAFTASYGTPLRSNLMAGLSFKLIYSKLAEQGAGIEFGEGTATGFGVDLGLLYKMSRRMTWGLAISNLGPDMAYIDASQSDPLPRTAAFGFNYRLLQSEYYHLLLSTQVDKMLVGLGDGFREEIKQVVLHVGAEFLYADIFALRGGYIHDEEGRLKTVTAGVGLYLKDMLRFDFGYYFGDNDNEARKGIKPLSLSILIP